MFVRIALILLAVVVVWATVARGSGASAPALHYTVKPADTLWSIAQRHYGGDPREAVWRIQKRNGLAGTALRPGQRIVLPR